MSVPSWRLPPQPNDNSNSDDQSNLPNENGMMSLIPSWRSDPEPKPHKDKSGSGHHKPKTPKKSGTDRTITQSKARERSGSAPEVYNSAEEKGPSTSGKRSKSGDKDIPLPRTSDAIRNEKKSNTEEDTEKKKDKKKKGEGKKGKSKSVSGAEEVGHVTISDSSDSLKRDSHDKNKKNIPKKSSIEVMKKDIKTSDKKPRTRGDSKEHDHHNEEKDTPKKTDTAPKVESHLPSFKADSIDSLPTTPPFAFSIGNLIGTGASSKVYSCLTDAGQFIALKQLELPMNINDSVRSQIKMFMSEISMMSSLHHPNIIELLGAYLDEANHTVNILLEFVAGGSLTATIEKFGSLSETLCKRYSRQILQGLEYLHRCGIAHRDIKGDNILVSPQGVVKLADFGCAKLKQIVSFHTLLGTPYFMAPEVLAQSGSGFPADIWSFGCTVIQMVTGDAPFRNEFNEMATFIFQILINKRRPQIPANASQPLQNFIDVCLCWEQERRLTATQLLAHEWLKTSSDS